MAAHPRYLYRGRGARPGRRAHSGDHRVSRPDGAGATMNLLRRSGAALLLVCSALTAALCLGGIVGVWVINQPAKELVADTLDTIDGYLTLANQTIAQIRD